MKKRFLTLLICGAMAVSTIACTKIEEEDNSSKNTVASIEYNVNDVVTLGQYKGMEITLSGEYEYTDEGFEEYAENAIASSAIFVPDDSLTTIEEDSIVNVDYVGSQDGVAFEGGSAEDQLLDIANNSAAGGTTGYIPGFTSGLVGHSVGEEVAYEVTFPESYGNTDLAGQTVIFTFQVNYIAKAIDSLDKITDEIATDYLGYETADGYVESLKESYTSSLESNLENDKETAVLNTINNICTVSEVPADLLQARVDLILMLQEQQYAAYGTTMQDYVESMGYDYNEVLENLKSSVEESTKTELILEAIADAENIQVDDGYDAFITDIYTKLGYTDIETFYKDYSVDGYDGQRYFELAYRTEKATDFLIENCVVNFVEADDTEVTDSAE